VTVVEQEIPRPARQRVTGILARARPDILELKPYASARSVAPGGRVRLDANESPWSPDAETALNRYPQPQDARLVRALAELYHVPTTQLLLTRGSDEGIDVLMRAFCAAGVDSIVTSPPTFGYYATSAAVQGVRVIERPRSAATGFHLDVASLVAGARDPRVKIVFVCNPGNPGGEILGADDLIAVTDALRDHAIVVVDEAYVEFADQASLAVDVSGRDNLVVLRTLSKAHALAGARVGALIGAPPVVELLRRVMAPYPLPTPSIEAALEALTLVAQQLDAPARGGAPAERERLAEALKTCPAVREVLPANANFVTFRVHSAVAAYAALLAQDILVRDVSKQPGLEDCLRATVGTPAETDALIRALADLA
jgi:histidinol-phosphate aminotransferase